MYFSSSISNSVFLYLTESIVWENQHSRRQDFGYRSVFTCARMCWWLCQQTEQGAIHFIYL